MGLISRVSSRTYRDKNMFKSLIQKSRPALKFSIQRPLSSTPLIRNKSDIEIHPKVYEKLKSEPKLAKDVATLEIKDINSSFSRGIYDIALTNQANKTAQNIIMEKRSQYFWRIIMLCVYIYIADTIFNLRIKEHFKKFLAKHFGDDSDSYNDQKKKPTKQSSKDASTETTETIEKASKPQKEEEEKFY